MTSIVTGKFKMFYFTCSTLFIYHVERSFDIEQTKLYRVGIWQSFCIFGRRRKKQVGTELCQVQLHSTILGVIYVPSLAQLIPRLLSSIGPSKVHVLHGTKRKFIPPLLNESVLLETGWYGKIWPKRESNWISGITIHNMLKSNFTPYIWTNLFRMFPHSSAITKLKIN